MLQVIFVSKYFDFFSECNNFYIARAFHCIDVFPGSKRLLQEKQNITCLINHAEIK